MNNKVFYLILIFVIFLPFASASHYLVGIVNDALDGTSSDNRVITLWNPANGLSDNLTDIVGINGNSHADSVYMIDCEMLLTPCVVGDKLRLQVFNTGDNYFSDYQEITVTGAGFDVVPNITINSPPLVNLNSPVNFANLSFTSTTFNCSAFDPDSNLESLGLYGNWGGGWHLDDVFPVSGLQNSTIFTKTLAEGSYIWNCQSRDNLSVSAFNENNFSLTIDRTAPTINFFTLNSSNACGTSSILAVCNTIDSLGIEEVIIQSVNPLGITENFSTELSNNNYSTIIPIDTVGNWSFNCLSYDLAGNLKNVSSNQLVAFSDIPEIRTSSLFFSDLFPLENDLVYLNLTLSNLACVDSGNFLLAFYEGDPSFSGKQFGENQTFSLGSFSSINVSIPWVAKVGTWNLFALADASNLFSEINETDNQINSSIDISGWQEFYGNISSVKTLSDHSFNNLSLWSSEIGDGNVFMADMEGEINWLSLQSIGKNINGVNSANDFLEIDQLLGMQDFKDSVYSSFTSGGVPKSTINFTIHNNLILDVPSINSTTNSNFFTGILWDSSDDRGDEEFSLGDKEDLVFVAKVNKGAIGDYGIYDYEIKVPVELRDYDSSENNTIYFYYELS